MWEALDSWPRKELLETLIKDCGDGNLGPWVKKRIMNYVNWDSDIIAHTYAYKDNFDDYASVEIVLFVPTDKMQGGTTKPYLKLTSAHNTQVILSAKDDEMELFKKLEKAIWAVEDFPEDMIQDIINYNKD